MTAEDDDVDCDNDDVDRNGSDIVSQICPMKHAKVCGLETRKISYFLYYNIFCDFFRRND